VFAAVANQRRTLRLNLLDQLAPLHASSSSEC
jgi:hypothetical protein